MNLKQSLNGKWKLRWYTFQMGEIEKAMDTSTEKAEIPWIEASVPGDVHLDLMKAKKIPDPFYGCNVNHCRWMEEKDWWYRNSFRISKEYSGKHIYLLFHGLDTFTTVYLNGKEIARHNNMFVPLEIDITDQIKPEESNELAVKLASPIFSPFLEKHKYAIGKSLAGVLSRKSQMSFGWDIGPRLITIGIWRDVEIMGIEKGRIVNKNIVTKEISSDSANMLLQLEVEWLGESECKATVELNIANIKESRLCFPAHLKKGRQQLNFEFSLESPKLWWPHNVGTPHLYEYELKISEKDRVIDLHNSKFGVRTVKLELKGNNRNCFIFKINGKKVFIKGINWTPPDAIFSRIDEKKYRALLELTRDGNMNMIRVWGGGIYEPEIFYQICDKLGIMVWQDFMFACAVYPEDELYLENVKAEAEIVVKTLRKHPSLIIWCGDNENDWLILKRFKKEKYYDNRLNRDIISKTCSQLDPYRPYIPSSPFSPSLAHPNSQEEGDTHNWHHGTSFKDKVYLEDKSLFVSEIGHLAVPDKKTLSLFLPEDKMWPPGNNLWGYHETATNGEFCWRVDSLASSISAYGAKFPDNLDEYIELTQKLQAEAYKTWIEHFSNLENCGGIILWSLCDCWPEISDSIISYTLQPKLAYHYMKDAFAKVKKWYNGI